MKTFYRGKIYSWDGDKSSPWDRDMPKEDWKYFIYLSGEKKIIKTIEIEKMESLTPPDIEIAQYLVDNLNTLVPYTDSAYWPRLNSAYVWAIYDPKKKVLYLSKGDRCEVVERDGTSVCIENLPARISFKKEDVAEVIFITSYIHDWIYKRLEG